MARSSVALLLVLGLATLAAFPQSGPQRGPQRGRPGAPRAGTGAPTVETVRLGYYDAKPSCFRDESGEPSGIFIDVFRAVARRRGWRVEYKFDTWDRLLQELKTGEIDLIPAIVLTPQRESFAVFTKESVMTDWGTVFKRAGERFSSILDLNGTPVGALEYDYWFSGPGSFRDLCAAFGVRPMFHFYPDYPSMLKAMNEGKISALVGSNSLGIVWTPQHPVVATSIVYNPIELRFAASRYAAGGADLARRLDETLGVIRKDEPDVFSTALAKYQVPLRREWRVPPWLLFLLALASLVLVLVVALLGFQKRSLRESERRLRSFFEDSPISIWEEDFSEVKRRVDAARAEGVDDWELYFEPPSRVAEFVRLVRVLEVNRATLGLLGYERESEALVSLAKVLGEEGLGTMRRELVALASGDLSFEGETVHLNARGEKVFAQSRLSVMPGYEETWARVLVSIVDLSERKRAERALLESLEEKELLLREVHHRVKNNLQIIISLINLQLSEASESPSASRMLLDMEARVRSMALVHETLYQSDNFASVEFSAYMDQLCNHLLEAYAAEPRRVRLVVSVGELWLPLAKAIPCGLLVNELVANALKHAFPEGRSGTIEVSMGRSPEGLVTVVVRDDGIGIEPSKLEGERSTIGLSLVKNLARQLGGSWETASAGGVEARVVFPG